MTNLLISILLIPLLSATLIAIFFREQHRIASFISVTAAFVVACLVIYVIGVWDGKPIQMNYDWFSLGGLDVKMGFLINKEAMLMLAVVTIVGAFIHLFSLGYMDDDPSKARYFAGLSIFMFSMLGIVLANNLIMLFVFWELVGFSSYALIAHYNDTRYATMASKKAFIANRVGDFGFLIGIIWTYWLFGTVDITELKTLTGLQPQVVTAGLGLLLICGFIGKSAQFPLHVWLPDAMAGPTPVSALIHAATMVAAGIYFLVRCNFLLLPQVLEVVLWLGAIMTAFAGLCALVQSDIKKILAYSTLSQLGYMAVAVGLGYPGIALFHLTTHACFKALLFLGAGSVIHSLEHEQDIFKMGGLLKKMPITSFTFFIGLLALCGVTFTSGYFSKDAILEAALLVNMPVFLLILGSALLTSVYMGRLFFIAFCGKPQSHLTADAKEASWIILAPLVALAVLSLIVGISDFWPKNLQGVVADQLESVHKVIQHSGKGLYVSLLANLAWMAGLFFSWIIYKGGTVMDPLKNSMPVMYHIFEKKFWFDDFYDFYVKKIQERFANILNFIDYVILDGIIIRGSGALVGILSLITRSLQTGNIQAYVYWFLVGLVGLAGLVIGWF